MHTQHTWLPWEDLYVIIFQLNRVKSIEKEKDELEEAKKEAEEFLAMKTDVAKKQHTLYQRYMLVCQVVFV